jgi:hypothetical protein
MGYLAACDDTSPQALRRALAYGTVVASFTCEGFSLDGLLRCNQRALQARYRALGKLVRLPG